MPKIGSGLIPDFGASMKADFIVNTITAWDEPPRARHQFTKAAARKFKMAFVTRNRTGWFGIKTYEGAENTLVIEPSFPIDYRFRYRLPIINEWYQNWLYKRLKRMFPDATVVNFDCTATQLARYFSRIIYYCNDEFVGNSNIKSKFVDNYLARSERTMASNATFCVTTSRFLTDKLKQINPKTYEIPLGVSIDGERITRPELVKRGDGKIVVGLMGVINERQYSYESVNLLLNHERLKLVLIGPVTKEYLSKLNNIDPSAVKGMLTGKELNDALLTLDVGLALYNVENVNPGGTPNKVWQYLALGKPAVVSNLPNMKYITYPENSVYITKSNDDLIGLIEQAYEENTVELMNQRIAFAHQNTWDHRFEEFLSAYSGIGNR